MHVRMQTFGTNPTTVRTKVWLGAASEPASLDGLGDQDSFAGCRCLGPSA